MAKKGMNIRYKARKRERNRYNPTMNGNDSIRNFGMTCLYVAAFLGLFALMIFGFDKLGLFQMKYTAPEKEETKIDYVNIPIGTVFNRAEKDYYVYFDNYRSSVTSDAYINELLKDSKLRVYKVDMSKKENAKYAGDKANTKANKVSDLSINDVTLMRVTNGRNNGYLYGSESIERFLSK